MADSGITPARRLRVWATTRWVRPIKPDAPRSQNDKIRELASAARRFAAVTPDTDKDEMIEAIADLIWVAHQFRFNFKPIDLDLT